MNQYVILYTSVITQDGRSALMLAVSEDRTDTIVELVKAGAKIDSQDYVCLYVYYVNA